MGQNPHDPRLVLEGTVTPTARAAAPALRFLRSGWSGWIGGVAAVAALTLACVDLLPWSLTLLPILLLAAHLAARAAEEWPRVGFPACVLGVGVFTVAAGLFRAGIGWSREWDALRHAGALAVEPGPGPVLGMGLAILLGGSFLGVLFVWGGEVWRSLSSIRLAVVTLSALGIFSIIGTMVVQRFGAGSLPEPEKNFVEKFLKGQGAMPVNARFMVAPPEIALSSAEVQQADLTERTFGEGKGRQMRMGMEQRRERSMKALAIEKHVEARREHLLRLFEHLETLGFTNVFRTWWFNALLVLVFVQVVAVLAKRYPWGWVQSGWVMTHVGVLITIVGCVLSDGFLKDGALGLSPGETADRFEEYTRLDARGAPTKTELGYRVRMLGTDQSFYHELMLAFPEVRAGDDVLWTQEQLRAGRKIPVKDPSGKASYEVRILEVHERALLETAMISGAAAGRTGGVPVLKVRFLAPGAAGGAHEHVVDEGYLFTDGYYSGRVPGYAVQYRMAASEAEAKALLAGRPGGSQGKHGTLLVRVPGRKEPLSVPATPGTTTKVEAPDGTPWTFDVLKYHPSYWVGRRPEEHEPDPESWPDRPVLEVKVRRGSGEGAEDGGRMIVYADPNLQSQWEAMVRQDAGNDGHADHEGHDAEAEGHGARTKSTAGPAALCSFRFDFAPAVETWVVEGPGVPRTLVVHRKGAAPVTADFSRPGATAPLGSQGLTLRLEEALADGVPDLRIQPLAQETDEQYIATCIKTLETGVPPPPTVAVAKIEVAEKDAAGERTRTEWLISETKDVAHGRDFVSTDGRFLIRMAETNNALMFRSALEVLTLDGKPLQVDGKPMRQVVRVNHPLVWGGYAYYQNSFMAASGGNPASSVFRVKYDRGIPTVYTGFAVLTLGVCIMLYVNPILRKRREAAPQTADAAGSV